MLSPRNVIREMGSGGAVLSAAKQLSDRKREASTVRIERRIILFLRDGAGFSVGGGTAILTRIITAGKSILPNSTQPSSAESTATPRVYVGRHLDGAAPRQQKERFAHRLIREDPFLK
jgi:hypothetical protein